MAFFIFKYYKAHKEKLFKLSGDFKKVICKFICKANYILSSTLGTIRKYPIYAAIALMVITVVVWGCQELADKNLSMDNKKASALKIQVDPNHNKVAKNDRSDRPGSQISRGSITRSDARLLAMVIEGEAAGEPMTGKVAVGAVILNRAESGEFPHSVKGVVYQPGAFESVMNGQYNRPVGPDSVKAADMALSGQDPTGGALYFWNPATAQSKWVWQRPVTHKIGNHVFAK